MRLSFIAAAVGLAAATALGASVKLSNSTVGTTGGPFTATVVTGPIGIYATNATFQTFCIERSELFTPNATYTAVVSDRSVGGNAGGVNDPTLPWYGNPGFINTSDLLDPDTAYLFTNFVQGTMTSVVASWTGSTGDLIALQDAIWTIEGETVNTSGATAGMKTVLINAANAANWTTIGNVRVMQLWNTALGPIGSDAAKVQDHLVIVPLPPAVLAGMGLMAIMGVGYIRRNLASRSI